MRARPSRTSITARQTTRCGRLDVVDSDENGGGNGGGGGSPFALLIPAGLAAVLLVSQLGGTSNNGEG